MASLGVAWTLAKGDKEEYWRLYRFDSLPFDSFQSFQLLFLGLFMREPKALTAVSDSHLLVGFTFRVMYSCWSYPNLVTVSDIFFFFQGKCVTCSPGRDKTSWTPNMIMWNCNSHPLGTKNYDDNSVVANCNSIFGQSVSIAYPSTQILPNHDLILFWPNKSAISWVACIFVQLCNVQPKCIITNKSTQLNHPRRDNHHIFHSTVNVVSCLFPMTVIVIFMPFVP